MRELFDAAQHPQVRVRPMWAQARYEEEKSRHTQEPQQSHTKIATVSHRTQWLQWCIQIGQPRPPVQAHLLSQNRYSPSPIIQKETVQQIVRHTCYTDSNHSFCGRARTVLLENRRQSNLHLPNWWKYTDCRQHWQMVRNERLRKNHNKGIWTREVP